ncbi:zinc finger protein 862-like [Haliotis rufescens]|uniref:zinc finger protein 862-like n=1 Tax=Haliotis rufescens TaxID=6454 RepID=UPI00201F3C10|nr:zinc finger protein 862-like [Haliotis rufescens]
MPPKRKHQKLPSEQTILKFFGNEHDSGDGGDKSHGVDNDGVDSECHHEKQNASSGCINTGKTLKFQQSWLTKYAPWLRHDAENQLMYCSVCRELRLDNAMAVGTNNFKTTTITRHITSADHQRSVAAPFEQKNLKAAVSGAKSKEERAIVTCLKVVYWMAKEGVPLSKYESLLSLLSDLNTPNVESLSVNNHVTYASYKSACGFLDAISTTIDRSVTETLHKSPVLTILTDESMDTAVHNKLCITARVIDPHTMMPATMFLTDLRITSATGKGIFDAIQGHLAERKIPIMKVSGLGTDGASVMTGRKEGLTGQFLKVNPHIINTHCSVHKVALCSEQAADQVPGMKYYQIILESIFYYFKKSALRVDNLSAVQKLLNEPTLKCREVHQVRWLSFFQALEAIYRTLDSLLSYFSTASDAKAQGLKKKIGQDFFISITYALMDILQPIMKMTLFFQRKDIDIGSVQAVIDSCIRDVRALLEPEVDGEGLPKPTFMHQLKTHLCDGFFKGNHAIKKSSFSFEKTRVDFIKGLIDNINKRFPDKQLMTSMCVFGMRPVTFLSEEELSEWGNESLDVLLDHFAVDKSHTFKDVSGQKTSVSPAIINREESKKEWTKLKQVVRVQGYPRHSTSALWGLVQQYHSADFPNMLKLASLVLTHPVHTSDCERAFSAQNLVTTPLRNRLSAEHCDRLMRVMIQGPQLTKFNFNSALIEWRGQKERAIFRQKTCTDSC